MPKHDPPGDDAALLELERELMEHEVEFADSEGEERLDFSHMGAVLAHGILTLADPVAGRAR